MKGVCPICGDERELLKHHISYDPEEIVGLCPACHKEVHLKPSFFPLYAPDERRPKGFQYKNNETVRISLDLSDEMFEKVGKICKREYRDKAGYLRLLINEDFIKRNREGGNKK